MNTDEKESTANQSPKRRALLRPHTGVRGESKKQKNNLLTRSASLEMTHYPNTDSSRTRVYSA